MKILTRRDFLKMAAVSGTGLASMGLVGCSSSGSNSQSGSTESSVDTLVSEYGFQWEDTSAPILNDAGAEAISFNIYSSKNASALDYNDMKIMQDLFASTNVTVNWENVSENVYSEQKNLIFSNSSDRPDAIYHAGMTQGELIKYAQRGVIVAISDYLEYMPNFSQILEERPDIYNQIVNEEDGKIYALPRIEEMGLLQNPNILFINKNWVQQVIDAGAVEGITSADLVDGLTLTCDQMEDILIYFRDHDMNGNGDATDERPLSFVYNNWQGNQCDLYGMFGLNDNLEHRVVIDDEIVYTTMDDRFMEATNYLANWVSEGLIDKVSFEQSQDNFLANGKGLETYGAFYWWESATVVDDPDNYIVCCPLIGPDGEQTVCVSNNPEVSTGELVFFSDCENVEVLLAYFDRYYDPYVSTQINYGAIGVVYEEELDENGKLVQKELPDGVTSDELRLQNAPLGIIYLNDYAWENVVNMEERTQLRQERLAAYVTPYVDEGVQPCPNLPFTMDELNTLSNYETDLEDYVKTNLISWLMNGGVSESAWENFKTELTSKCHLDEIREVYQSGYDRYLSET
ncbi:MAG: twin-arginine translocation signal domain-containing protein [Lachnospiraceae bacterium]|nr:twin-arginine translocation signal domain-containing protein [Lachnospiraceae bacterium]